jgi:hypothetical protein
MGDGRAQSSNNCCVEGGRRRWEKVNAGCMRLGESAGRLCCGRVVQTVEEV